MRVLAVILLAAMCLSACGKMPSTLETAEGATAPRSYPQIEKIP